MKLVLTLKTPRVFITKANFSVVFTEALAGLYDSHTRHKFKLFRLTAGILLIKVAGTY